MLWFNFILGLNFLFFCFKLIIIVHYHTQTQKKIKLKPKIKLNHEIYTRMDSRSVGVGEVEFSLSQALSK